MAKKPAFNKKKKKKKTVVSSKFDLHLRKNPEKCCIWSTVFFMMLKLGHLGM